MAQAMAHGDSDGDGDGSSLWGWYPCTWLKFRGCGAQASVELSSDEWAISPHHPPIQWPMNLKFFDEPLWVGRLCRLICKLAVIAVCLQPHVFPPLRLVQAWQQCKLFMRIVFVKPRESMFPVFFLAFVPPKIKPPYKALQTSVLRQAFSQHHGRSRDDKVCYRAT